MRKQWIADEEKKLEQLTRNLQAVKKLINQVEDPNLESHRFLRSKEAGILRERDRQFMKVLRIYNEHPKLSVARRCLALLHGFSRMVRDRLAPKRMPENNESSIFGKGRERC